MLLYGAYHAEFTLKRQNVKSRFPVTSNFEVHVRDTVIAKAVNRKAMQTENAIINIDEDQNVDIVTAKQLARIVEFLLNLDD